jgi:hypothetical protein
LLQKTQFSVERGRIVPTFFDWQIKIVLARFIYLFNLAKFWNNKKCLSRHEQLKNAFS